MLSSKVSRWRKAHRSPRSDQISVRRGPRLFAPEIWSENVAHLRDLAVRCLSAASFGPRDVFASNLAIVTYGANVGVAFSLVTFFWRRKSKLLPRGVSALVANEALHSTVTLSLALSPQGRGD